MHAPPTQPPRKSPTSVLFPCCFSWPWVSFGSQLISAQEPFWLTNPGLSHARKVRLPSSPTHPTSQAVAAAFLPPPFACHAGAPTQPASGGIWYAGTPRLFLESGMWRIWQEQHSKSFYSLCKEKPAFIGLAALGGLSGSPSRPGGPHKASWMQQETPWPGLLSWGPPRRKSSPELF